MTGAHLEFRLFFETNNLNINHKFEKELSEIHFYKCCSL